MAAAVDPGAREGAYSPAPGLEATLQQALDWGLVAEEDIVRGDLRVSGTARRNLNFRVERRSAPSYLIKQGNPASAASSETVRAEARFYRFCSDEPAAARIASLMPPLVGTFESDQVLVLELVQGGRHPWQEYREQARAGLPLTAPAALGRALGELHAAFSRNELARDPRLGGLRDGPPNYFGFHRPHPQLLRDASPARLAFCRCLQEEPSIGEGLERARDTWRVESVVHGDVRSENILVIRSEGANDPRVLLLDWEFVQRGDPAWDVAGALEDLIRLWLESMSQQPDLDAAERLTTAAFPLPVVQAALASLWEGYVAASGREREEPADLLRRATAYSGARLVQTAWEHCRHQERLPTLAVLLIQVAANVLADPERAAGELYGLA